jgi:hypothetical protein
MKIRAAALFLVAVTFAVGAVRAHAQGRPPQAGGAAELAARVAALEARLTALETIDESDIVGSYKYQQLGIELNRGFAGTPGTPARVNTEASDVVITLNADHTVDVSGSTLRCTLPVLTLGIASCQPLEEEPVTFTWSFANGVLTISGDPEDGPMEFAVPASGVIVFGGSSEFQPGHSWANIGLLVKMAN